MAAKKRTTQRAGSQLNRSETVTVRLDPKLNYLCDLAARSQRRTKSSLIEAALAQALNIVPVDPRPIADGNQPSIAASAEHLWHVDEVERLRRLAHFAPHLMNYEEQKIWATMTRNGFFWAGHWEYYGEDQGLFRPDARAENLILFRAEEHWETIKAVASGERPESDLPQALYFLQWSDLMVESTIAPPASDFPATKATENG